MPLSERVVSAARGLTRPRRNDVTFFLSNTSHDKLRGPRETPFNWIITVMLLCRIVTNKRSPESCAIYKTFHQTTISPRIETIVVIDHLILSTGEPLGRVRSILDYRFYDIFRIDGSV